MHNYFITEMLVQRVFNIYNTHIKTKSNINELKHIKESHIFYLLKNNKKFKKNNFY
jgi:hypothetical protein